MNKQKKTRGDTKVRIIEMSNRSRKGTYIYVKEYRKPSRYYKYKGVPIDIYRSYYQEKYTSKKPIGSVRRYEREYLDKSYKVAETTQKRAREYVKEITKKPTINQAITRGITQVTVNNIHDATQRTINQKVKTLLKDLVLDEKLLEMVTKPENIKKIKHRFEYTAVIKNTDNQTITTYNKFNMTPQEAINEIRRETQKGEELGTEGYTTGMTNKLQKQGWQRNQQQADTYNNTIRRIDLIITFRKG